MRRARLNGYWLVRPRNGKKMVEAGFGLREREGIGIFMGLTGVWMHGEIRTQAR